MLASGWHPWSPLCSEQKEGHLMRPGVTRGKRHVLRQCQSGGDPLLNVPVQVCATLCPLPALGFSFHKDKAIQWIAQEVRRPPLLSGCGPEDSGLNNASADGNRLWNTYCLSEFCCIFFFSVKRKRTILPSTFLSSTQPLSNLEVCSSYKTTLSPRCALLRPRLAFSRTRGWKFPQQLALPFKSNDKCAFLYTKHEASLVFFSLKMLNFLFWKNLDIFKKL